MPNAPSFDAASVFFVSNVMLKMIQHGWIIVYILISLGALRVFALDYPNASLSTTWINRISAPNAINFKDGSKVIPILLRGKGYPMSPGYACGFYCKGVCDSYLFSIFILQLDHHSRIKLVNFGFPQVVWSANRDCPVKENATLQLTAQGDFLLRDVDGVLIWSTNTTGRSVSGLNLTETGNLVLFDVNKKVVWQSFDHPTDSLVPAQRLYRGLKIRASVSNTNWTVGLYTFSVHTHSVVFSIKSNPQLVYLRQPLGTFNLTTLSKNSTADQYTKLEPDGHMRIYSWDNGWWVTSQYLTGNLKDFQFPLVCGNYGISSIGQCSCPLPKYLKQTDLRQSNLGCSMITPLECNASHVHILQKVEDVSYFTFEENLKNIDSQDCQKACLKNCSCKGAIFRHGLNPSWGDCYLPSQIFSLIDNREDQYNYNLSVFLKVHFTPDEKGSSSSSSLKSSFVIILASVLGCVLSLAIGILILLYKKRGNRIHDDEVEEEDYLKMVSGMPTRFSLKELEIATENFTTKLGEGGFGSVFEGLLKDGTKIAVKRLDGICQVKGSFLTEVGSIGNIHHVNLVRLVGFCAEKSHRLLVYEHMANGSLDKWIYRDEIQETTTLDWKYQKSVVLDIAKGLAYLHEDCRQKIIHLDIKPQNILLDEKFNAKLSDFGMSKLIARDQSTIVTTLRGTPGYLAPEWLSSAVTEKVDVYSFGVVMMEILCARRLFDLSKPDHEQMHLLSMFNQKSKEGRLLDMIENCSEDMKCNETEVVKMMEVAAWCLQNDYSCRPSMSLVVKVLEGVVEVDLANLDYNFLSPLIFAASLPQFRSVDVTLVLPSVLSGPR